MPSCVGHITKFTSAHKSRFWLMMESEYWTKKHVLKAIQPFEVNEFTSGTITIYDSTILHMGPTLRRMVPALGGHGRQGNSGHKLPHMLI